MSAINDALRRASSAAKTGSASPLPPMPVEPSHSEPPPVAQVPPPVTEPANPAPSTVPPLLQPRPEKKRSKLVPVLIILFVLVGGAAGGFYFWQKQRLVALAKDGSPTETEEEITDNDRIAALFGDEKAAVKLAGADMRSNSVSAALPTVQVSRPAAAPVPVTVTVAPSAPAPIANPPVRFPPLRLQSIFYRPSSPSVIINGKTLFVSDEINGVTVADIKASSVTLVLNGQTNILTLR